jgi:hypothetical protein
MPNHVHLIARRAEDQGAHTRSRQQHATTRHAQWRATNRVCARPRRGIRSQDERSTPGRDPGRRRRNCGRTRLKALYRPAGCEKVPGSSTPLVARADALVRASLGPRRGRRCPFRQSLRFSIVSREPQRCSTRQKPPVSSRTTRSCSTLSNERNGLVGSDYLAHKDCPLPFRRTHRPVGPARGRCATASRGARDPNPLPDCHLLPGREGGHSPK